MLEVLACRRMKQGHYWEMEPSLDYKVSSMSALAKE